MSESPPANDSAVSRAHDPDRLRAPTVDSSGRRRWLYPDRRPGPRASFRKKLAIALMVFYLVAPYLKVNGLPLLRLDVLAQKAYFMGAAFHFHEATYLVFIFLVLALALFLVTSLFGRVWCGYACPQTVYVEWLIRPIEEFFEGNAFRRRSRDLGPLGWDKVWRKVAKYLCFTFAVVVIANASLAFFVPPETLWQWVTRPPSEQPLAFAIMLTLAILLFLDLVWFREQFCSFVCPYARFQALMFDRDTPTVTYDERRGEPRGRGPAKGDCIDCQLCVRVCPTGIDIRDGLQLECIQCARCADACDQVMTNIKRPTGLIRISSQAELEPLVTSGRQSRSRWLNFSRLRLRPLIYAVGLVAVLVLFVATVSTRPNFDVSIVRQPASTFVQLPDGKYANYFRLRVVNRSQSPSQFTLQTEAAGVALICSICDREVAGLSEETASLVVVVDEDWPGRHIFLSFGEGAKESIRLPILLPGAAR